MSLRVSKLAAAFPLPKGEKAVLKVLADRAAHDGTRAFPGVGRIARETGYSERQVQRLLRLLEDKRLIRAVAYKTGGRNKATEYELDLAALETLGVAYGKDDIHGVQRVTFAAQKDDRSTPQRPEQSFELSGSAQNGLGLVLRGQPQLAPPQNGAGQPSQQEYFARDLKRLTGQKSFQHLSGLTRDARWAHFEAGIFRKHVSSGYFDCTNGGLGEEAAVREALHQAVLSLLSNRAVELRRVDPNCLEERIWLGLRTHIPAFAAVHDYERRERHVVKVVIRAVVAEALAFVAPNVIARYA